MSWENKFINKVVQGDCLKLLKELPDNSVDLIITDPPYGIKYHSGYYKKENPFNPIINDDKLFLPLDELWRVLKDDGCMFVFFSHKVQLIDKRLRNIIIWVKNNWTAGDLYGNFGNQYECIGFIPKKGFKLNSKRYSNVWNFKRVPPTDLVHPTQKPLSLIKRCIKSGSQEENIVLDCFLGSGTTAVACKMLNRNFIGIELSEEYCKIARERLSKVGGLRNYFGEVEEK